MKKLGFALLGLLVLLIAAVLVGPSFVDWNEHKGRFTAEVRELTGREIAIDGDISLSLLPAPALSAAKVRFANAEGGSEPAMATLEALEVRVAFMPLLQGRVQVESVSLVKPVILLEVLADGRKNWDFATREAETAQGGAGTSDGVGLPGEIRLDSVTIRDGTLIYRDAAAGREERIGKLNAEIAAESLKGPFAVTGKAEVRGQEIAFEVGLGRLVADGATSLNLSLGLPGAAAKMRFGGAVSVHQDGTSLRGRVKAEGESLAGLIGALAGGGAAPPVLARPFGLETEVAADSKKASAAGLTLRLGEMLIEGDVVVSLGPPVDARINLSAPRLDLDKLLADAEAGSGGTAPPAPAKSDQGAGGSAPDGAPGGFALPDDMTASLQITVDALVYRGQVVRQILLSAGLAGGKIKVSQALALLPGGSDVSLTGTLALAQQALRFDGRVEVASDNFRGMLEWVGADVSAVPAERLRRMSLTARIDATPRQVNLNEIDLRIDVSRATGGVAVVLRERPGLGIGLTVDKINLDAYLPRGGAAGGKKADAAGGDQADQAAQPTQPALAVLGAFDANLDLKLGSLAFQGVTARDLRLDATVLQGTITVREARLGNLAGNSAQFSGTIAALEDKPAIDGRIELKVPDPVRLAKLAKLDPGTVAKFGPFDLTGTLKGTMERLAVDAKLAAVGGQFGAAGTVRPLAAPPEFDVAVTAEHPDLGELANTLAGGVVLGPGLGGLNVSARAAGTPAAFQVSGLKGALGPAEISGSLRADLSGSAPAIGDIALDITAKHPDLGALVRALAPGANVAQGLGEVDLKAKVAGDARKIQVSELAGRLGPVEVSGALGADLTGAKPVLKVDLSTGVLPVAALFAPASGGAKKRASGGTASTGKTAGRSKRWSNAPIDVSALNALDADVMLRSKALLFDNLRMDDAVIDIALVGGLLELRKVTGVVYDGLLLVTGKIDARDGLQPAVSLTVSKVNLAKLLRAVAKTGRVSGPLDLTATLSSKGRSEAELVSALTGKGDVRGSLQVKVKQEEQIGSALLGILGQQLGDKVGRIRGITDATNLMFNAFAGAPVALNGTFTVKGGVVETRDLRLDGRQATALTSGAANLPAWRLDSKTDVFLAQNPNTAYLTVGLRGPLDAPNPRISGQPFQRQPQAAPAVFGPQPSSQTQTQTQPAPAPKKLKPEDILKEGLKKTLKGLFGN
ncbi:MAG: AsmA family protein [Kiloniellales bacterium]